MVEAVTVARGLRALLLALLALPSAGFSHRLDEYLQATIVVIEPGELRLEMNLTPGVAVAGPLLAEIDRDGDGAISTSESAAYADSLRRDLTLRLDGRPVELTPGALDFPEPAQLRTGEEIIQLRFSAAPGPLAAGAHRLTIENRHRPAESVYLFNAAAPRSGAIEIVGQTRNGNQSVGEIAFAFHPPTRPAGTRVPAVLAALGLLLVLATASWALNRAPSTKAVPAR